MTREENVFLAKRNLVDTIYKSAKLEGLAVTFPQTEAIIYGGNLAGLKVDEITAINNLKHAWSFVFDNLDYPLDYAFVCKLHQIIGSNLIYNAGFLRKGEVYIGGINPNVWKPSIPQEDEFQLMLRRIRLIENPTERAIETMLYCARTQPFWDGNKRTAMLAANQILVSHGQGILSVSEPEMEEFKKMLIEYYITGEKDNISQFIYDKCIYSVNLEKDRESSMKTLPELNLDLAKEQLKADRESLAEYSAMHTVEGWQKKIAERKAEKGGRPHGEDDSTKTEEQTEKNNEKNK